MAAQHHGAAAIPLLLLLLLLLLPVTSGLLATGAPPSGAGSQGAHQHPAAAGPSATHSRSEAHHAPVHHGPGHPCALPRVATAPLLGTAPPSRAPGRWCSRWRLLRPAPAQAQHAKGSRTAGTGRLCALPGVRVACWPRAAAWCWRGPQAVTPPATCLACAARVQCWGALRCS
jgi:hypothetical protein